MAPTLIHTVKTYFTSDFTGQAADTLNEHKAHVAKALEAIIPTTLAGILNISTSGKDGSQHIFERSKEEAADFRTSHDVNKLLADTKDDTLASDIFGKNWSFIEESIVRFSGVKTSSVSTLTRLVIPGILGLLGKHDGRKELSASGLSGFLASERKDILIAIPPGLTSVADLLDFGALDMNGSLWNAKKDSEANKKNDAVSKKNSGQIKWMVLFVIILLIVITVRVARC